MVEILIDLLMPSFQAQSADEVEIPGGEIEVLKQEVDFVDEKLPPENGVATIIGEAKKHRPPPLIIPSPEKVDTLSLTSLKRTTSRSSIASVKSKILVTLNKLFKINIIQNCFSCPCQMSSQKSQRITHYGALLLFFSHFVLAWYSLPISFTINTLER